MSRFFIFLSVFSCIFFIVDFYGYQGIKQLTHRMSNRKRKFLRWLYWIPSILTLTLIIILASGSRESVNNKSFGFFYFATGFIFLFLLPKTIFLVFHLLNDCLRLLNWTRKKFQKKVEKESVDPNAMESEKMTRIQFFNQVGLGAAAITFGGTLYGIVQGKYDFRVMNESIKFKNLPPLFSGMRIVQISDAHLGSFLDNSFNEVSGAIDLINSLKPDIIFFTGDLVNNFAEEAEPWIETFARLQAPFGKFSILGNHDYAEYVYDPNDELTLPLRTANMQKLEGIHKAMGFRLLRNEMVLLEKGGQNIELIGIENWGRGRFSKHGDLELAMQNTTPDAFRILLSHDPSHWEEQVLGKKDIALTFSGHTHGAQFGLEAPMLHIKISPSPLFGYKRWGGLYNEGEQYLYVNRGFGFLGFPGRVGIPPEITCVDIFKG
jgi:predicted MPP superfamily phosphohydrolase